MHCIDVMLCLYTGSRYHHYFPWDFDGYANMQILQGCTMFNNCKVSVCHREQSITCKRQYNPEKLKIYNKYVNCINYCTWLDLLSNVIGLIFCIMACMNSL